MSSEGTCARGGCDCSPGTLAICVRPGVIGRAGVGRGAEGTEARGEGADDCGARRRGAPTCTAGSGVAAVCSAGTSKAGASRAGTACAGAGCCSPAGGGIGCEEVASCALALSTPQRASIAARIRTDPASCVQGEAPGSFACGISGFPVFDFITAIRPPVVRPSPLL